MNCEQFRSYNLEQERLADLAAIQHRETCADCRRYAYAEEELARRFQSLRESAPKLPAGLDAAMMHAFRGKFERQPKLGGANKVRWAWALIPVAAAFVLVTILAWPHLARQTVQPPAKGQVMPPPAPKVAPATNVNAATPRVVTARKRFRSIRPKRHEPAPTAAANDVPESGFQNLMYCDSLSCSGDMQMIRIQLPASAVERVPALRRANGMVQADVVVGSDGVARAIRIVR